jgi:hypothetical protein
MKMTALILRAFLAFSATMAAAAPPAFVPYASQGMDNGIDVPMANQTLRLFLQPGIPSPVPTVTVPIDLQGNGRPDVLGCHLSLVPYPKGKFPCRIFRPQADGSMIEITTHVFGNGPLPSLEHPRGIALGDFNGDGRPDVFVAGHGYDASPFDGETNLLLISNADGTYSDRSSTLPQQPDFTHSTCVGDIDSDGRLDIYANNQASSMNSSPYFLMGNGDGTFTKRTTGLPVPVLNLTETYTSCALADMDGDGHVDLVLGRSPSNGNADNYILFNDGTGDFTVRPRTALPVGPLGMDMLTLDVVPIDVNRDGRMDLIILSQLSSIAQWLGIQILVNQSGGGFADETATRMPANTARTTGPWCDFLRVVDFNGDGHEDFFCTRAWEATTQPRYWINNGNGTWYAAAGAEMPDAKSAFIVPVDFDGDGRTDLMRYTNDGMANMVYRSFRNVTPILVPSAPLIRRAVAGHASAAVFFSAPLNALTVTNYTATCRRGNQAAFSASGVSSPIIVSGLANATLYSCTVQASGTNGLSLPSESVTVMPSLTAPLALLAVKSRKLHGAAGLCELPIDAGVAANGAISIEPRNPAQSHQITFAFNAPIDSIGAVTGADESSAALPLTFAKSGAELTLILPPLGNGKRATLAVAEINGIALNAAATVGFLIGDINGSRTVNAGDISAIKAIANRPYDVRNCLRDLNLSGQVDNGDLGVVKLRSGQTMP